MKTRKELANMAFELREQGLTWREIAAKFKSAGIVSARGKPHSTGSVYSMTVAYYPSERNQPQTKTRRKYSRAKTTTKAESVLELVRGIQGLKGVHTDDKLALIDIVTSL